MALYLHPKLKQYFSPTQPLFEQVMALRGQVFRHLEGRRTQRIMLGEKSYFIKQHEGVGWKEVWKNLCQLRWPVISAKNEWQAIEKLSDLNINTPMVMGYGKRGWNPAALRSFILMEELAPVTSLEDLCRHWREVPPAFEFKLHLIEEVARIARVMHAHGINHRDFYICHFLLNALSNKLYLIDLHRAQIRAKTPERWVVKDLAGLYFSSQDIGLTRRDYYRFIRAYRQQSLRDSLMSEIKFWNKVKIRGEQLYRDHAK